MLDSPRVCASKAWFAWEYNKGVSGMQHPSAGMHVLRSFQLMGGGIGTVCQWGAHDWRSRNLGPKHYFIFIRLCFACVAFLYVAKISDQALSQFYPIFSLTCPRWKAIRPWPCPKHRTWSKSRPYRFMFVYWAADASLWHFRLAHLWKSSNLQQKDISGWERCECFPPMAAFSNKAVSDFKMLVFRMEIQWQPLRSLWKWQRIPGAPWCVPSPSVAQ